MDFFAEFFADNFVLECCFKVFLSAVFGIIFGVERSNRMHAIGIRTMLLITTSCALLGILSYYGAENPAKAVGDPTRIAAGVVTGVGFLGGGVIMHQGFNIKGITTAAIIWTAAALGLSVGYGLYVPAVVVFVLVILTLPLFKQIQGSLDALTRVTSENLSGARVIRAFGREETEEERFASYAEAQTQGSITVGLLSAFLNPSTFLILNLGVVAILWSGALRVDAGGLTQGQVVAFVNYMTQTLLAIVYVANLVVTFTRGAASGGRIMEVLRVEPQVQDAAEGAPSITFEEASSVPALTLDHVSFAYPGASEDALHDVSLSLSQGSRLGVIGGTGSGKSTLASLLVRLYDPREGTISLMGHDLRTYSLRQLHHLVAIVPQKTSLITGTIRSNLLWRDEHATDEELWNALERAQAAAFVREKPLGLDEPVEAGGKNFSGGQRQRLTIARALVGEPLLLVLDDAASALDMATDAKLRSALAGMPEVSTVTISQRVTSIMGCDLILVLYHGKVAGLGTHKELLRTCELYREIAHSQLMGEEVAA